MAASATKTPSMKKRDDRLLKRAERAAVKDPDVQFTPEALKRLTELESEAQSEMQGNPDLKLQFAAVSDFLQQWALLKPEDQAALGKQFQERANALVDIPFNQELTDLRSGLGSQLKALNQKYQFLTEDEEMKLTGQLDQLDRDTTEQLTNSFINIEERGLGNSGMLRQVADAIMNNKEDVVAKVNAAAQLDLKQGRESLQTGLDAARADNVIKERGVEQERTVAREEKKSDLVSRAVQTDLLQQIISGATELTPRDLSTYKPSALNPDALPGPDGGSTTSPVADIPPAQRIRNLRLGISGAKAPTIPTPVAPVVPAPRAPSTSTAGMTAEERRQIRLNRLPKI